MKTNQKERPIIFSTPMVQAILSGNKTQTRRIIKSNTGLFRIVTAPYEPDAFGYYGKNSIQCIDDDERFVKNILCPYGKIGDVLYVRECFCCIEKKVEVTLQNVVVPIDVHYEYKADAKDINYINPFGINWKPSIHMPKAAARIFLEITNIRVERLQDITEADAIAEGIEIRSDIPNSYDFTFYRDYECSTNYFQQPINSFRTLWQSINGLESWQANPWVWVIEFKRINA